MNPDNKLNALIQMKDSKECRKTRNKSIKIHNRDVKFRNFIRKHK